MEIEIRAKSYNKEEILEKLKRLGWTGEDEVEQNDVYYVHETRADEVRGPGHPILRIRKSPKGNFLTFKALTDRKGVWDEHEIEISDPDVTRQILLKTGFVDSIIIVKKRIKGNVGDIEICVDDLNIIGPHIECEIISDDWKLAKERLSVFLESLGISRDNFEHRGYGEIFAEIAGIRFKES